MNVHDEEFWTVSQVAKKLQVHPATVRRWIVEGRIRKVEGMYRGRIPTSELERFVQAEYAHPTNT